MRPNPTAPTSSPQLQGADEAGAPISAGGGGGGGFLAMVIISLVLVTLVWIPMACIYPLTAFAGGFAGLGAYLLSARLLPPDGGDVASLLGIIVGAVVVWKVYRLEHRLAQHPGFRLMRHVVRLLLLAVWVIPIIELTMGGTAPTTTTRYVLATVSNPRALVSFLTRPQNLLIWVVAIAALHFLLWSDNPVRRWWHRRLTYVGLK
ncbi:MAG: hypothetical protein ABJD11_17070 [Gemmatimonadota bacterium]